MVDDLDHAGATAVRAVRAVRHSDHHRNVQDSTATPMDSVVGPIEAPVRHLEEISLREAISHRLRRPMRSKPSTGMTGKSSLLQSVFILP